MNVKLLRDIPDAIRYGVDVDYEHYSAELGDVCSLCAEHDEHGHPTRRGLARAEVFVARARNWTPTAWRLYGLWCAARVAADIVACALLDHVWVSDDYGGPDSGCVGAHCARCGYSFHTTLY